MTYTIRPIESRDNAPVEGAIHAGMSGQTD